MLLRYKFHLSLDLKYSFLTFMSAKKETNGERNRLRRPCTPKFFDGLSCLSRSQLYRSFLFFSFFVCGKNPPPHGPPSVAIYYTVNI